MDVSLLLQEETDTPHPKSGAADSCLLASDVHDTDTSHALASCSEDATETFEVQDSNASQNHASHCAPQKQSEDPNALEVCEEESQDLPSRTAPLTGAHPKHPADFSQMQSGQILILAATQRVRNLSKHRVGIQLHMDVCLSVVAYHTILKVYEGKT